MTRVELEKQPCASARVATDSSSSSSSSEASRRSSTDVFGGAAAAAPPQPATTLASGCDSSNCVFCQRTSLGPFTETLFARQHTGHSACTSGSSGKQPAAIAHGAPPTCASDCEGPLDQASDGSSQSCTDMGDRGQQRKRWRTGSSSRGSSGSGQHKRFQQSRQQCHRLLPGAGWRWEAGFASREDPPRALLQLVRSYGNGSASQSDIVSSLDFSRDGRLLCAAGVSKEVRLYRLSGLQHSSAASDAEEDPPIAILRTPAKISSALWCPDVDSCVSIGDYDGSLSTMNVISGHVVTDIDAHRGHRIWSVAHSPFMPNFCATTSEDKTAKLWSNMTTCVATIVPPGYSSICGADFSPAHDKLVALASSDHNVYLYDLRRSGQPYATLSYHSRPVSYVKFFGADRIFSASTDGTLACWNTLEPDSRLDQNANSLPGTSCNRASPWRVFRGHRNRKNFVGLSVRPADGLVACGSETSNVFAYHTSWSTPLSSASLAKDLSDDDNNSIFVSAVAWHSSDVSQAWGIPPILACATSQGGVNVLTLNSP